VYGGRFRLSESRLPNHLRALAKRRTDCAGSGRLVAEPPACSVKLAMPTGGLSQQKTVNAYP
jgi:hypothetical protein